MNVESVGKTRVKKAKKAKLSKTAKEAVNRQARFENWARNIDANGDGQISKEELNTRITNRTAQNKRHPFASYVLNNLSTLDKLPDDGKDAVTKADAAKFLADQFKLGGKKLKKLDTSA